jgi:hypothetical protein
MRTHAPLYRVLSRPRLLALACLLASPLSALTISNGVINSPAAMAATLAGPGVTVVASSVTTTGSAYSRGLFSAGSVLGISSGVVLGTGAVVAAVGPNQPDSNATNVSYDMGGAGDSDLATLAGGTTYDASSLSFDVIPVSSELDFNYVFSSEEYQLYVSGQYNDAFAFFVNGSNIALLPSGQPVTIHTVNASTNPSYFVLNETAGTALWNACSMNGMTTVLTSKAAVTPGVANHIKLVIADGGDPYMDSNVFIAALLAPTATCTPTITPTSTVSPTSSQTGTSTDSPTVTATPSATGTSTPSSTATPSFSGTITPSSTPTATPNSTSTPSATPSSSATATPSCSATRTQTFTATATATSTATGTGTPTRTATPSATSTPTPTASPSATPTSTASPTASDTCTPTQTGTQTASATQTSTATATPTFTQSPTQTASATQTSTATATPTFTQTPTQTASATQTSTATATPTFTQSPTQTASPTLTLTATSTATASSTSTITATATRTGTATRTPTYTLTETGTCSPTQSVTPSDTPTGTVTPTCTSSPTFTQTYTVTVTPSVTLTPVPEPFSISVAVYNTAGEKVRALYQGSIQALPASVSLSATVLMDGAPVLIYFTGYLDNLSHTLSWDGSNDQGQAVSNGDYLIAINWRDSNGAATTLASQVMVVRTRATQSVAVYSPAGERVATLPERNIGQLVDFTLPDGPSFVSPVEGQGGAGLRVLLKAADGQQALTYWDGRNASGAAVSSGVYLLELQSQQAGGEALQVERSVMLLRGPGRLSARGALVPNPAGAGTASVTLEYHAISGCVASAQVFDLSGSRVCQVQSSSATGRLSIPIQSLSAGVYLVRFAQVQGGAVQASSMLKLAIVR